MTKNDIVRLACEFTESSPNNFISAETALNPDCAGMKIYDAPIFAFGAADDELFDEFKKPGVIGSHFMAPAEWLPDTKTVISFFLPFTDKVKAANSADCRWPADEWLHGRIEGQKFLEELSLYITEILSEAGYESLVPFLDPRYKTGFGDNKYTSNWSERHIAFACGLGTFGLSKGVITRKGTCGRFGSVVTELDLPKDVRNYREIYEYCTMCGECISRCPAHAISFEEGKVHTLCNDFLNKTRDKHFPRYGCGKCQVSLPCENGIPVMRG